MFERFTEGARHVVVGAQQQAKTFGHSHVGTEHLLLALAGDPELGSVMTPHGLSPTFVQSQIAGRGRPGLATQGGTMPFTPDAKRALERALGESLQMAEHFIGPEHLLLGLLTDSDSTAMAIVQEATEAEMLHSAVLAWVASRRQDSLLTDRIGAPRPQPAPLRESAPTTEGGVPHGAFSVYPDGQLTRVLRSAAGRALAQGRHEYGLEDLIGALQEEPGRGGPQPSPAG